MHIALLNHAHTHHFWPGDKSHSIEVEAKSAIQGKQKKPAANTAQKAETI
jgi:hypothetical protein